MMARPIEVLVHISAPSGARDDARYRKQAQGLLDFEVFKRHDTLTNGHQSSVGPLDQVRTSLGVEDIDVSGNGQQIRSKPSATVYDNKDDQGVGSESDDIGVDNTSSAAPSQDTTVVANTTVRAAARASARSFQSRLERRPDIHVHRTPATVRPTTAPTGVSKQLFPSQGRRSLSDSWETPPSVIPDSQPWTSNLKRTLLGSSSSPYDVDSSPSAKRPRLLAPSQSTPQSSSQDAEQSAQELPTSPDPANSDLPSFSPPPPLLPEDSGLPIQRIIPPPPPTSLQPFATAAIPSIRALVQRLPLNRFFRPVHTLRPPRAEERGFWRVCIPKEWDVVLRKKFWDFLERFIGKGESSWLWCERYLLHVNEEDESTAEETLEKGIGQNEEIVRVYCWGEVVEDVYLLLFLGIGKRIRGMGATWHGSGGEVVTQME